jgi:HAD superfamily hydrolase (TIGR01549 family)
MRAILFDFGGTLDYPRHWLDRFLQHYRAADLEISRSDLDAAYDDATRLAYEAGAQVRELGLRQLVRYLVKRQLDYLKSSGPTNVRETIAIATEKGQFEDLVQRICKPFLAESAQGLERSKKVLLSLSARFKLGVVSNFYGNLDRVLAEAGIAELIQAAADSTRIGISKPAPGIFEEALRQLAVEASESVMVGDSLDKDCAPARRLGLKTVWLRTDTDRTRDVGGVADYTITDLEQLEGLGL